MCTISSLYTRAYAPGGCVTLVVGLVYEHEDAVSGRVHGGGQAVQESRVLMAQEGAGVARQHQTRSVRPAVQRALEQRRGVLNSDIS